MRLRALSILLLGVACHRPPADADAQDAGPPAAQAPAPAAAQAAAPPPTQDAAVPAPMAIVTPASERQAGGRPLSWWRGYLRDLHATGPAATFDLAVQRARANGLRVEVTGATVTVEPADGKGSKP